MYGVSIETCENIANARVTNNNPVPTTRLTPNFETNLSLLAAAGINPKGSGKKRIAASNGEYPLTNWKCNICINMNENITKNARLIATSPTEYPLLEKKDIGNIGCGVLFSHLMKTISEIIPITKAAITSLLSHPRLGPSIIPYKIELKVTIEILNQSNLMV